MAKGMLREVDDGKTIVLKVKVKNVRLSEEDKVKIKELAENAVSVAMHEIYGNSIPMVYGE